MMDDVGKEDTAENQSRDSTLQRTCFTQAEMPSVNNAQK